MRQKLSTKKLHFIYKNGTEDEQQELRNTNNAYLNSYLDTRDYANVQNRLYKQIKDRIKSVK